MNAAVYRAELDYGDGKIKDYFALTYSEGSEMHRVILIENIGNVASTHVEILSERGQDLSLLDFPNRGSCIQFGKSNIKLTALSPGESGDIKADLVDKIYEIEVYDFDEDDEDCEPI